MIVDKWIDYWQLWFSIFVLHMWNIEIRVEIQTRFLSNIPIDLVKR